VQLTRRVATDIRTIIDDDVRLEKGIAGALEQYNLDQFVTVDAPDQNHQVRSTLPVVFNPSTTVLQVIISESGRVGDPKENRFIDPRSKKSFVFDHLNLVSQCTIATCSILTHPHRMHKKPRLRNQTHLQNRSGQTSSVLSFARRLTKSSSC